MSVAHVWLGHGSALFLELGEIGECRRKDGSQGNPKGAVTVMADFGWRIEGPRSIVCASGESNRRIASAVKSLLGSQIIDACSVGRIPELQLAFSNGRWLQTFTHYAGQPAWALLFSSPRLGALGVKAGHLSVDEHNS